MNAKYPIALAVLAGIASGSVAVQTIHAQTKPPVYFISVKELTDPDGYKKNYAPLAQESIQSNGGKILAAGSSTVIAGDPLDGRIVILAWDSMDQLRGWFESPEYQKIREIGEQYSRPRYYLAVPGIAAK